MFANIPDTLLIWAFQFLTGAIVVLGGVWVKRLQSDVAKANARAEKGEREFLEYKLEAIKEFSGKDDAKTMRNEILTEIRKLEVKIDSFNAQLTNKADKAGK